MAGSSRSSPAPGQREEELPGSPASEARRRARLSRQVLVTGIVLGLAIIGLTIWLGSSTGAAQASQGLSTLGSGDVGVGALILSVIAIAVFTLLLGLKDRVIAKIGLRNVSRARTRTLVLLFGLLIGSAIISSSLVIGDTVNTLSVHFTYIADGAVDEAVWAPAPASAVAGLPYQPFPSSLFTSLNTSETGAADVQGLSPMLIGSASAFDLTRDVAQPGLTMIGVDAWASQNLGSFTSVNGTSVPGPRPGWVLLNPTAASELSAQPGDAISLSSTNGTPESFHVLGVVQADTRGGFQDAGLGDVFVALPDAQSLALNPNIGGASCVTGDSCVNYVAVTNTGGLTGGPSYTKEVWSGLNVSLASAVSLAGTSAPPGLSVHVVLLNDILSAEASAQSLTQLFLVLGLFSIGAGCVLIVGIFAMLAEERRGEMGVARAVGMRRGQLIRAYYFEGFAYSAGSALLGTLVGVGVGWAIIQVFASIFGAGDSTETTAILQSFSYTPTSLVLAYAAGFLLTLVTVTVTSAYVSRMNIVRAIRSQPELIEKERSQRRLLAAGALLALLGALLFQAGRAPNTDLDIGYLGVSLLIVAVGLLLSFRLPLRYAFSASAIGLLIFWADLKLRQGLFPGTHTGTIFVFFQEGIFLILAAVILYVFNSDLIVRGLSGLSRGGSRNLPVVRLAFSYPSQRKFRSAMTISIFAMVLFTITAIAAIGNGISSGVATSISTNSGGYEFYGFSASPIADLPQEVENNSTLRGEVSTVVPFYTGGALVDPGSDPSKDCRGANDLCFDYSLAAAPSGAPSWENFYTSNQFNFTSTLGGMSTSEVWSALQVPNNTYAVVDGSFTTTVLSSFTGSSHVGASPGQNLTLVVANPTNPFAPPVQRTVTVLAVMAQQTIPIILLNPELMLDTFGFSSQQFFLLTGSSGSNPVTVVQNFQTHFYAQGLEMFDFSQLLSNALQFTSSFIDLLEVFVALGLIVGITALGILALRAVVERRTQIGVVRAVGFRRSQVLSVFLTEYSFLALMGIAIGAVMGLVLAYNLNQSVGGFFAFAIPWKNLALVLGTSYALTLLATGAPSFRASRIPPAEAIRYSE